MPERRPRADRAQQFMPFAALKGYYDLIRERERVVEPKRELTDEQALELSRKLDVYKRQLQRGGRGDPRAPLSRVAAVQSVV